MQTIPIHDLIADVQAEMRETETTHAARMTELAAEITGYESKLQD